MDTQEMILTKEPGVLNKQDLPPVNFSHLINLTDKTGIIQHAIYQIPNRKEGY